MRAHRVACAASMVLSTAALALPGPARAQPAFTGSVRHEFPTYTGAGLASPPGAGQVDSDLVSVVLDRTASGICDFAETCDTGAFALGPSTGDVTDGGLYAFDVGGAIAFGVQPRGLIASPGELLFRHTNTTGAAIASLHVELDFAYHDSGGISTRVSVSIDAEGSGALAAIPALTLTTPIGASSPTSWVRTTRVATVTLDPAIPAGGTFILHFDLEDDAGTGASDELGLVSLSLAAVACGDGAVQSGEACDEGSSNGATICGCQLDCTYGAAATECAAASGACDAPDVCDGEGACVVTGLPGCEDADGGAVSVDGGASLGDGGAEPAPDGGSEPAPDGGVEPWPDGGVEPRPDGGVEPAPDAGVEPRPDGGVDPAPDGGCGCRASSARPAVAGGIWILLGLLVRLRRRRGRT